MSEYGQVGAIFSRIEHLARLLPRARADQPHAVADPFRSNNEALRSFDAWTDSNQISRSLESDRRGPRVPEAPARPTRHRRRGGSLASRRRRSTRRGTPSAAAPSSTTAAARAPPVCARALALFDVPYANALILTLGDASSTGGARCGAHLAQAEGRPSICAGLYCGD